MKRKDSKYQLTKDKFFSREEQAKIWALIDANPGRDAVFFELALQTGARAQELLNISRKDLDQKERTVYIRGIKGSNNREIPLTAPLFNKVMSHCEASAKPFPFTYARLVHIWHRWRPTDKPFHAFRHTFAINLYDKTKDLKLLQIALGHRSINNTMIYADFSYSKQEMRRLLGVR